MAKKKLKAEKAPEKTPKNVKLWDVFDDKGRLINIYEEKERAEILVKKNKGWKVAPSPKDRTREDVQNSLDDLKAGRLAELKGRFPEGTASPI